jgi:hypothetical protein
VSEPDPNIIKEIVAEVFRILWAHNKEPHLTKTSLQKVLYALRCELPETNYVRAHLAYYWYRAGPFSEYVAMAIDEMAETNDLEIERRAGYELITLAKSARRAHYCKRDRPFLQATSLLDRIVLDHKDRGLTEEVKDQYWLEAPLKFYPRFRFNFKPQLNMVASRLSDNKPVPDAEFSKLQSSLQELSASLPNVSVFSAFKRTYFDYANALMRLTESKDHSKELAVAASRISEEIWNTFASGARLLVHDPPYERKVSMWRSQFDQSVAALRQIVEPYYRQIIERIGGRVGEQVISEELFVKQMVDLKRDNRLLWIRPERVPENLANLGELVGKDVGDLPEFRYFLHGDALDFPIITKLDLDLFRRLVERYVEEGRFYVAIADTQTSTRHLTFDVIKASQPI